MSFSIQDKVVIKPHEVNRLDQGEFMGILAETVEPVFHTQVKLTEYQFPENAEVKTLPVFYSDVDTDLNFERIRLECNAIVTGQINPVNAHRLIKSIAA